MDNLPFPSVPLQYYENTFLQRVVVEFGFNALFKEKAPANFEKDFSRFVNTHFGVDCNANMISTFWQDGIQLTRNDKSIIWLLKPDSITVLIGTIDYKSFVDSVLPIVYKMRRFVGSILEINNVTRLQIRKINAWQFYNNNSNTLQISKVQQAILSKNLLNEKSNSEILESEKQIPNLHKISYVDDNDTLNIRYFCRTPQNNDNGVMILYLDTEFIENTSVEVKDIEENLVLMNKVLYNAFHWCVTNEVIDIMKGRKNGI